MTLDSLASRPAPSTPSDLLHALKRLDERLLWLACWTIHNANHLRDKRDGLKVGGHQASCASMSAIMTALYFSVLRPQDRVAVKPHASPLFHAVQYMLGRQTRDQLERFRAFGGAQSYPSRTKDKDDVDFSTGSVGLGVAVTAFAALAQDFLAARGALPAEALGRMISILGDAELDEGNIYEALIEAKKHDLHNCWWIVDYNRQSLDAVAPDRMFERFDAIFAACDWEVVTLKYGRRQREAFARPGGAALKAWIDAAPNDLYAALAYEGGAAWRQRLSADLQGEAGIEALLDAYPDEALSRLMTELGGHCLSTLLDAFAEAAADTRPRLFIAYTIKGYRLPFQGHKDNHAGLMTPTQIDALRERLGVKPGEEWEAFSGLGAEERAAIDAVIARAPFAAPVVRRLRAGRVETPDAASFPTLAVKGEESTQAAFGRYLFELAKRDDAFADRLVTMSPDVTVSTNLGGFVNRRGLFARAAAGDLFKERKLQSPQAWMRGPTGQHVELGIAENNLFLCLAAFGLTAPLFGERLFPIGTLYDPFIARGLDALNYACYQDARFMVVATPSGLTLGPEGGAHQSISTPLIGLGQPGLTSFEPAFVDELGEILRWSFNHMQDDDGGSVYLRLTTRSIEQPQRADDAWRAGAVAGGYWLVPPAPGAELAIVFAGAVAPEAIAAHAELIDDAPGAGLLAVTSPDRLYADWFDRGRPAWRGGQRRAALIDTLLAPLSPSAGLVTVIDASPLTLSWIAGVRGQRVRALGVDRFGQTGDLPDLYREYRLDADAILDAAADVSLG